MNANVNNSQVAILDQTADLAHFLEYASPDIFFAADETTELFLRTTRDLTLRLKKYRPHKYDGQKSNLRMARFDSSDLLLLAPKHSVSPESHHASGLPTVSYLAGYSRFY